MTEKEHWKITIGAWLMWALVGLSLSNIFLIFSKKYSMNMYLLIANMAVLFFVERGISSSCDSCLAWFSVKEINYRNLQAWNEYQDIVREDVTRNKKGDITSTTSRVEQIVVTKRRIETEYQCDVCGHSFTTEKIR